MIEVKSTLKQNKHIPLEDSIIQKLIKILLKNKFLVNSVEKNEFLRKKALDSFMPLRKDSIRKLNGPVIKTISLGAHKFKILIDPRRNGSLEEVIYFVSHWELEISELIMKHSNKNEIFVDVGANNGYHSLYASFFFKEVVAFEPLPSVFNQFKQSIKLNNFSNIKVHNLACSNKQGKNRIYYYRDDPAISSLNGSPTIKRSNQEPESLEIKTVSLDRFLKKTKNRIGLVKMDVEGHEHLVIEGMKEIIKKHKPLIITEFLPVGLNKIKQGHDLEFLETLSEYYEFIDIERNKKVRDLKKYVKEIKRMKKEIPCSNLFLVPKKTD